MDRCGMKVSGIGGKRTDANRPTENYRMSITRLLCSAVLMLMALLSPVLNASAYNEAAEGDAADILHDEELAVAITAAEGAIREAESSPSDHSGLVRVLNHLASLLVVGDKQAEAELLYKRALSATEDALGAEHPDVAECLDKLATLYASQEKYAAGGSISAARWVNT